jgi:hypothetical protein
MIIRSSLDSICPACQAATAIHGPTMCIMLRAATAQCEAMPNSRGESGLYAALFRTLGSVGISGMRVKKSQRVPGLLIHHSTLGQQQHPHRISASTLSLSIWFNLLTFQERQPCLCMAFFLDAHDDSLGWGPLRTLREKRSRRPNTRSPAVRMALCIAGRTVQ